MASSICCMAGPLQSGGAGLVAGVLSEVRCNAAQSRSHSFRPL